MLNKGESIVAALALLAFLYVMWGFESPSSFYKDGGRTWEVKKYGAFGYYSKARCAMMPSPRPSQSGEPSAISWPEPKEDVWFLELSLTIIVTVAVPWLVVSLVRLRQAPPRLPDRSADAFAPPGLG